LEFSIVGREKLALSGMAKPNYQGEKRRKDLAKLAKKKEKLAKKLEKKNNPSSSESTDTAAE